MSKTKETPCLTLGQRNNNPGNIRYNKSNRWLGLVGKDRQGFCKFSSMEYGFRALIILLFRYIEHGYDTPKRIIYRYAPIIENNSSSYLHFVLGRIGISEDTTIIPYSMVFYDLISAIAFYESKIDVDSVTVKTIYDSFRRNK